MNVETRYKLEIYFSAILYSISNCPFLGTGSSIKGRIPKREQTTSY